MTEGEWIKANPERRFRLRPSEPHESGFFDNTRYPISNLWPMTVIDVSASRKSWGIQNILVPGVLEDTDGNAQWALDHWNNVLFPRLIEIARSRSAR